MRQPHQILAFPYKKDTKGNYLYGIFYRKGNTERWQGIAGGVEEGETFLEACKRETNEEAGISYDAKVIELKSISTMPVVNVTNETIRLSHEHTKMEWLSYEDAKARLKWDSNKNALWELNWKLLNNKTDI